MSTEKTLSPTQYSKLLGEVRQILDDGKQHIEGAKNHLAKMYWEIGKRITQAGLSDRTHYGKAVIEDIAHELGIEKTTIHRAVTFFSENILAPRGKNLTWSHYRELIPIKDPEARTWYRDKAETEKLTKRQLVRAIQDQQFEKEVKGEGPKEAEELPRPMDPTHLYKAELDRVIDGDTVLLRVDLGFSVWKEERVRLAGIDAAPIDTEEGEKAYKFVRDALSRVEYVMLKTVKMDVHGRYVGHIFFSTRERTKHKVFTSGHYLNGELVARNLAKVRT